MEISHAAKPVYKERAETEKTSFLRIYIPGEGYLCRAVPKGEGKDIRYMIVPIGLNEVGGKKTEPLAKAREFIHQEFTPLLGEAESAQLTPVFKQQVETQSPARDGESSHAVPTDIFEVQVEDEKILEELKKSADYVVVPEELLLGQVDAKLHELQIGGQTIEAFIHPDCRELVDRESPKLIEITGRESQGTIREIAKYLIRTVEKVDSLYDTGTKIASDRLTLDDIDKLRYVIEDKALIDDLETAFIKEKLVALAFQQICAHIMNGAILSTVLHDPALTLLAVAGAIGNDTVADAATGKMTPVSFEKLLTKTITEIFNKYDASKANIRGMGDKNEFIHSAAASLPESLKSKVLAEWGSVVATSSVLIADGRFLEAGISAGLGAAMNLFGMAYKRGLSENAEKIIDQEEAKKAGIEPAQDASKKRDSMNLASKLLIKGGTSYLPNFLAGFSGLSRQQLELGVHIVTFLDSMRVPKQNKVQTW